MLGSSGLDASEVFGVGIGGELGDLSLGGGLALDLALFGGAVLIPVVLGGLVDGLGEIVGRGVNGGAVASPAHRDVAQLSAPARGEHVARSWVAPCARWMVSA